MRSGRHSAYAGLVLAAACASLALPVAPAAAHPLGLPAFAQVSTTGDTVTVVWNAAPDDVAALARSLGITDAPSLSRAQDAALSRSSELSDRVLRDVEVRQDGQDCEGRLSPPESVVTRGLTVLFDCPRPVRQVAVRIALLHDIDERYRTLAGSTGPDGAVRTMFSAGAPEHELDLDPEGAPAVATTQRRSSGSGISGAFGGALPLERRFVAAVDSTPGVLAAVTALLVAFAVGALHALAPGHGKAVAAGYLIGEQARARHALALGATVALMHTGSVLVLGLALFSATRAPDAARLSAAIGLVTGLTFAGLGVWLLARRWRARGHRHHHHDHQDHQDHHEAHALTQAHADGADADQRQVSPRPLSLQGIVVLGAAGGLLPSPSALLVLLTALAVGRVAYGLTLIAVFSLGLATTVTLVGVAVLRGRDVAHDRAGARLHRLVHAAPLAGALAVTAVGTALAVRAAGQLV